MSANLRHDVAERPALYVNQLKTPPLYKTLSVPSDSRAAASPRVPASQIAGPSRTLSMVPIRASTQPKVFESRPVPPISFARSVVSPPFRRPTIDQSSSSRFPSAHSTQSLSPPPSRGFPPDEPVYSSSSSEAPSRSLSEGAWDARDGENVQVEEQVYCDMSHGSTRQEPDNMRQYNLRIFELVNDSYNIPTRRIAIRSFEHEEICYSYCEAPWVIKIL